jgi:hypothetical protein
MVKKLSSDDIKILKCGAKIEGKEHPWTTPTQRFQIAKDHGPEEYRNRCK